MTTKLARILTLAYAGLGIVAGYISNMVESRLVAVAAAFLVYIVSYVVLVKMVTYKKKGWLVGNTLITFILVWLVVWIFLFNTVKPG